MTWGGLSPPYSTIVADPPWEYEGEMPINRGTRAGQTMRFLPYSSMSVDEIAALPVADLARPGAHLYLWTTNHYLWDARDVARSWGFEPSKVLVWCKDPVGHGLGGLFASTTEFIVFAHAKAERQPRREVDRAGALIREAREAAGIGRTTLHRLVRGGRPTGIVFRWEEDACLPTTKDWARLQEVLPALAGVPLPEVEPPPPRESREVARVDTTWWKWPRGAHSEKPAAFLDVVEQVSPGTYVELFARQPRLGWDSWGWGYEGVAS